MEIAELTAVESLVARLLTSAGVEDVVARTAPGTDPEALRPLLPLTQADDVVVPWSAVNGRRIDVAVRAGEREWSVVFTGDADGVDSVVVFEKPPMFAGVPGGQAVLLIGPSSVGKSTVMKALVEHAESPWVMFDEISFGTIPLRHLIWRERAPTLRPGFCDGIAAFAAAGNQVVAPGDPQLHAALRSAGVAVLVVALLCPFEILVQRQGRRADRWGGLTEETQRAYDGWDVDLRIQTDVLSPEQSAQQILNVAARTLST